MAVREDESVVEAEAHGSPTKPRLKAAWSDVPEPAAMGLSATMTHPAWGLLARPALIPANGPSTRPNPRTPRATWAATGFLAGSRSDGVTCPDDGAASGAVAVVASGTVASGTVAAVAPGAATSSAAVMVPDGGASSDATAVAASRSARTCVMVRPLGWRLLRGCARA